MGAGLGLELLGLEGRRDGTALGRWASAWVAAVPRSAEEPEAQPFHRTGGSTASERAACSILLWSSLHFEHL